MLNENIKKIAIMACLFSITGCGLFSGKELPQGERIAVLNMAENINLSSVKNKKADIPEGQARTEWAQFGSNAEHLTANYQAGGLGEKAWDAKFGEGSSKRKLLITTPIVYNNTVIAQDVSGTVSAFELESGRRLWKQKIKPQIKNEAHNGVNGSGIAAADNKIFATLGFGSLVALEAQTGEILWRQETNVPLRTAPTICGNKILVQTLDNRLFVYNTKDGTEIWRYNVAAEDTVLVGGAVPACSQEKNLMVAGFSNGEVEALNVSIGYPLWTVNLVNRQTFNSGGNINAVKAAPVIDGETVYAIGNNDSFAAIDYRSGEKIWERRIGGVNMPWLAGDYVFIVNNLNEICALNKKDGKTVWTTALLEDYPLKEKSSVYLSGPVMVNGKLYVAVSNGLVYVISAQDGALLEKKNIGTELSTAPIVAGGYIIFTGADARLIVYK